MPRWTAADVPDLHGRRILVTGGNSGIGLEAARIMASRGAELLLACRNTDKGDRAADDVREASPGAVVDVVALDLADLASVDLAAEEVAKRYGRLDVLINNAGVMALPYRRTADGFEMQFGTNHLGHFALTGRLLESLLAAEAPRVVTVSSNGHKIGRMAFDNLDGSRRYEKWTAYTMSKLANLLFTFELQRRAAGTNLTAAAAHPGYASTNLQTAGPQMAGSNLQELIHTAGNALFGQSSHMGALPTVFAAVDDSVRGGDYIGPRGPAQMRGYPVKVKPSSAARSERDAARLWEISEELTGVPFDALRP